MASYEIPPDVEQLLEQKLKTGEYVSRDAVLRDALHALDEHHAILGDIRQGIEDLDAGRGRPLEEVDADLRKKHNIPHDV